MMSEANQTGLVLLLLSKGKEVDLRHHFLSLVKSPAGMGRGRKKAGW